MALAKTIEHLPGSILHHELSLGTLALGAFSYLYVREKNATAALKQQYENKPKIISRWSDVGDHSMVIRVGFRQDPEAIADTIDQFLAPFGSRHYMKSAASSEANKDAQLKLIDKERGRSKIDILLSKGGKDRLDEYADSEFMDEYGPIEMVNIDSSPFTKDHIRWRGRAALAGAKFLPSTHSVAQLYSLYMNAHAKKLPEHSTLVADEHVRRHLQGTATTNLFEAKKEVEPLLRPVSEGESLMSGMRKSNIGKLIYYTSPFDSVVDTYSAYRWLRQKSGRDDAQLAVDTSRNNRSHAGSTEWPERLVTEIKRHINAIDDTAEPHSLLLQQ